MQLLKLFFADSILMTPFERHFTESDVKELVNEID